MKLLFCFVAVALSVIAPLTGLAYAIGGPAYAAPAAVGLGATAGVFALLNRDLFR